MSLSSHQNCVHSALYLCVISGRFVCFSQVTFHAQHPGVYMAKVNVIPSPVVTDESTVPRTELYSNVVHIEGIAEQPDIEVCNF